MKSGKGSANGHTQTRSDASANRINVICIVALHDASDNTNESKIRSNAALPPNTAISSRARRCKVATTFRV